MVQVQMGSRVPHSGADNAHMLSLSLSRETAKHQPDSVETGNRTTKTALGPSKVRRQGAPLSWAGGGLAHVVQAPGGS